MVTHKAMAGGRVLKNRKGFISENERACTFRVLEKAVALHSNTLAWRIPWTEEPGRLQSTGSLTERLHFHFSLSLEKEMATHSSVLAWRIPGTGEPGGLLSMGSHRVGHD